MTKSTSDLQKIIDEIMQERHNNFEIIEKAKRRRDFLSPMFEWKEESMLKLQRIIITAKQVHFEIEEQFQVLENIKVCNFLKLLCFYSFIKLKLDFKTYFCGECLRINLMGKNIRKYYLKKVYGKNNFCTY